MSRIGLVVDNPSRDLDGLILLSYFLRKLGHTPILIPMYQQSIEVPLLNLNSIVMNYIRYANLDVIKTYKQLGIKIYIIDTEGGVLSENGADSPDNWAKEFNKMQGHNYVDGYFFWGDNLYQAFKTHSKLSPEKLHLTGCPRYDFCNEKWSDYFNYPHENFVLINTNFSAVNPKFSKSKTQETSAFLASGWQLPYVEALLNDLNTVFTNYIDVLKKCVEKFPKMKFLIRPHPFENNNLYINEFSKFDNVIIYGEGNVFSAIKNCKFMIHLNCGSSVETLLLKKLPVNLDFLNTKIQKKHTPLPRQISHNVNSIEDLYTLLENKNTRDVSYSNEITGWFGKLEGNSAESIAKILVSEDSKSNATFSLNTSLKMSKNNPKPHHWFLGSISFLIGSKNTNALRILMRKKRKEKFFTLESLKNKLAKIEAVESAKITFTPKHSQAPFSKLQMTSIEFS